MFTQKSVYTQKLSHCYRETFTQRGFYTEIAAPKPDLGAKAKKTILKQFLRENFKVKSPAPKLRKSADKSLSQPLCSHSNTIYDVQLQKTIALRTQPRHQATFTQLWQRNLQSLPCKSNYNCVDHHCNQQELRWMQLLHCSVQPKITKPIGTAQSTISLLDMNNESALYHDRSETNTKPTQPHPSRRRGSPFHATPGATVCEKTLGFMRFLTPKHHLDTAVPLRSAITALQITLQLRRPQLKSTRWMQPLHCKLQHKITKPIDTAQSTISWLDLKMHFTMTGAKRTQNRHSRTRRADEVPYIDAGSHLVRKNIEFRASPKHHLTQQFQCDLHSLPCKSHYNCADHLGNQQDGCSHSNANCNTLTHRSRWAHWPSWKSPLQWHNAV